MSEEGVVPRERPEGRRWTIYVCPGCGSYASEYDLDPRFGNIVTHERMTEACVEPAERVKVVEAGGEGERLEDAHAWHLAALGEVERLREALRELYALPIHNIKSASIIRAALAAGPPGGEGEE